MTKHFSSIEEVLADESFLSWYAGDRKENASGWSQWLSANPQYGPLVKESILFLDQMSYTDRTVPVAQLDEAHSKLMKQIGKDAPAVSMRPYRWWLAAAAVLLIVAGILYRNAGDEKSRFTTAYGKVAAYHLPDGSEVMLNANSTLSISEGWEKTGDREVWLEGEAFFQVKKGNTTRKFIVHTANLDVIVTGTQFNVVNRNGESNVLLTEGSVTLEMKDGKLVQMEPGDFVTLRNNYPQKAVPAQEKILAWKEARIIFEKTPMSEAARSIEQHYGVKVVLDRMVRDKPVTAILPNDNLDVLLKALEATQDFTITRKDDTIYISNPVE